MKMRMHGQEIAVVFLYFLSRITDCWCGAESSPLQKSLSSFFQLHHHLFSLLISLPKGVAGIISSEWHSRFLRRSSKVFISNHSLSVFDAAFSELQQQYTNYKNSLQQLAQRIGEIEQDTEEHK